MMNEQDRMRRDFFNQHAAVWEERCYSPKVREGLEKFVVDFDVKPATRVLDVGCGSGVLVPYLRHYLGANGEIIELDQSPEMLKYATQKESSHLFCLCASVESIPLIDEYVDQVICFACFPHFSDKAQAVREIARVLRKGGLMVIAHMANREELNRHHAGSNAVMHDCLPPDEVIKSLIADACLELVSFEERPGRFLIKARKR